MNVVFHKRFDKMASKLSPKIKAKMVERITVFSKDPLDNILRNHALNTPYRGSYSIDITGDYRAIYYLADDQTALFTHIGVRTVSFLNNLRVRTPLLGPTKIINRYQKFQKIYFL